MMKVELGTECEIITKGTTPTSLGKTFTSIGVGFLRAQNVINNRVLIDSELLYIDNETHNNELKRSQIKNGDILLTIAGTIGRTAIVRGIDMELNCNQAVAIIRLGNSKINKEFLCHFIASPNAQDQFFKGMVTATIANLSLAQVRKLQIPLPPLTQQKKIAAILDAADANRQLTKALIAKYDELTQSLFLDMFGDPVKNEKGWEKVLLKSVCNKITDGTHDTPKRLTQGVKFITGKHIKPFYIDFENSDYVTEDIHTEIYKRCNPEFGDILYTNIGVNYATAAINTVHYEFSMKNVALLKYKRELLNGNYLQCILNNTNFKDRLKNNFGIGGAQQFLSLANIKSIELLCPPLELQNQFAERVQAIETQKAQAQASLEKAEELFNSLLQRAFNGELV